MEEIDIAVIGGGPAGLRAAEVAAGGSRSIVLFDGKPGVGRKFLVAGRGGLNLTHGEDFETFVKRYSGFGEWTNFLADFTPEALREWCDGLGQETFQASSGRIYPKSLKGAPLLRAWIARLREKGVEIRPRHLWKDLLPGNVLRFEGGPEVRAKAVIFALGGASWPKTGSDGGWIEIFREMGIACESLVSSNCGWECDWAPEIMATQGMPLKNIRVTAGETSVLGELMVTRYGLEGGAIYALGRELRSMKFPAIHIDFKPTFSSQQLVNKLGGTRGDLLESARRLWKISDPAFAILSAKSYDSCEQLAEEVKNCCVHLLGPRPIAEAISSAGGIAGKELDENLMLRKIPGAFACGEMIDWDAPTGGYLLQGAFSTGTRAGNAASDYVDVYR